MYTTKVVFYNFTSIVIFIPIVIEQSFLNFLHIANKKIDIPFFAPLLSHPSKSRILSSNDLNPSNWGKCSEFQLNILSIADFRNIH